MSDINKDHIEELLNHEWHQQGACLLRHEDNRQPHCNYPKNCREYTILTRKAYYQRVEFKAESYKKVRYLRKSKKSLTRTDENTGEERILVRDTTPIKLKPGDARPEFWDIDEKADGRKKNFKPSGPAHYPYRHQWHHLLPSGTLYRYLLTTKDSVTNIQLHYVLMKGKYNLHHGRNVALLPEEEQVGKLVMFPTHPNNHPEYDDFVRGKLTDQKEQLLDALKAAKGNVHDVDEKIPQGVAENLHKVSDRLFRLVEAFGRCEPGRELLEMSKFARKIDELLNPK